MRMTNAAIILPFLAIPPSTPLAVRLLSVIRELKADKGSRRNGSHHFLPSHARYQRARAQVPTDTWNWQCAHYSQERNITHSVSQRDQEEDVLFYPDGRNHANARESERD